MLSNSAERRRYDMNNVFWPNESNRQRNFNSQDSARDWAEQRQQYYASSRRTSPGFDENKVWYTYFDPKTGRIVRIKSPNPEMAADLKVKLRRRTDEQQVIKLKTLDMLMMFCVMLSSILVFLIHSRNIMKRQGQVIVYKNKVYYPVNKGIR